MHAASDPPRRVEAKLALTLHTRTEVDLRNVAADKPCSSAMRAAPYFAHDVRTTHTCASLQFLSPRFAS
jgi:hypothetical protein